MTGGVLDSGIAGCMSGDRVGTPVLRGRDRELAAVGSALTALDAGGGGAIVVDGPPGIGKTRLLAEASARARRSGMRVLRGDALDSQRRVPYGPLLAATLDAEPAVLDADALWAAGGHPRPRFRLVHELRSALAAAASRSPLVVVLDDLHRADDSTLAGLPSLVTGLARFPIRWLVAVRSRPANAVVREMLTRLRQADARGVHLGAIAPDAVAAIVTDVVRARATPELLRLAERAQGYPYLLVELLKGLDEEGRLCHVDGRVHVVGDGVPERLATVMRERLDRLSPDTRQLVHVAAVLPERFSAAQLAGMLRRPTSSLLPAFEQALLADVLAEDGDQLRFRHDLLREATYATLPDSVRRALSREAVGVLRDTGAPPTQLARQVAASAEPGDRQAVATLRAAAPTLASRDPVTAADLGVRAVELSACDDPERGALIAEAVQLLHRADRAEQARELAETALGGLLSRQQESQVRLSLSTMAARSTAERAGENRRGLELRGVDKVTRARHQGWLAYNLMMSGEAAEAEEAAEAALADGLRDPQSRALATVARSGLHAARGEWASALTDLERLLVDARSRPREPYLPVPEFHRANLLAVLGRLDDARRAVDNGLARAQRERGSRAATFWRQLAGVVNVSAGRLAEARTEAEATPFSVERVAGGTFTAAVQMLTLAGIGFHTGDRRLIGEMARAARRARHSSNGSVRRVAARVLAAEALRAGQPAEADRWLADDPVVGGTPVLPYDLDHLHLAARVALACPRSTLAERVRAAASVLERADAGMPVLTGVAAHARGLLDDDADLLVDAAERLRGGPRPLLFAAAAADAGSALAGARRGSAALAGARRSAALELLNQAFDTYRDHGAEASARQVGRTLRGLGVARRTHQRDRPVRGLSSLTEAELKVVRLVARGATNRAVADQMVISPHTVSSHLRRAFAKLDIHSRTQLAHLLHAADQS